MRVGLAVYGTTFGMGIDTASKRPTITPRQLLDKVSGYGLLGVELPASMIQGEDVISVAKYAQKLLFFSRSD